MSKALDDVAAERQRQMDVEGWTPEHDDQHSRGELAIAAGWYALNSDSHNWTDVLGVGDDGSVSYKLFGEPNGYYRWPWSIDWWKPTSARRDLVKAGALILAEIERLDRAEKRATKRTQK